MSTERTILPGDKIKVVGGPHDGQCGKVFTLFACGDLLVTPDDGDTMLRVARSDARELRPVA